MTDTTLRAHVLDPSLMDESLRPQDDLYAYINGGWLKDHVIPDDRPIDGSFYHLHDQSEDRCLNIANDAIAGAIDDPDAQRIATVYQQFMDEGSIEAAGIDPIRPLLSQINSADNHDALSKLSGELLTSGIDSFFTPFVSIDANDTTRYIVYFEQSGLGLPDESYYREEQYEPIREAYVAYIAKLLNLSEIAVGDDAYTQAALIMQWETKLAEHHWDNVRNRDAQATNNPRSFTQVKEQNPGFNWNLWVDTIGVGQESLQTVNVDQPDYLVAAANLWENAELDTLKVWMSYNVVGSFAPIMSKAFVEAQFDFYGRTLSGTQELRERWKRGLGFIESTLGEAMGRLYVQRHFTPEYKDQMLDLVDRLLQAYRSSIESLTWMGDETRERALAKLDLFNPKIAYPPKWRDYSTMNITPEHTFIENFREAARFNLDYSWSKLSRPVDRDEWHMTPQTVNAYYNPTMNEIVFPAAILQPPFFDPKADDAVNFAAIGAVIGHEIGHGFDDQGSQFDGQGTLSNWWTDDDRAEFEKRTGALIKQYDAYTPRQLSDVQPLPHVNGALTIGENIGDLGGLTIAWKAWAAKLAEAGTCDPQDAPIIDGLTGPQRFFYSWARIWQSKCHNEYAEQLLAIDPHSPAEFRCNGTVRNMDAFVDAFHVEPTDALWLDRDQRVSIW